MITACIITAVLILALANPDFAIGVGNHPLPSPLLPSASLSLPLPFPSLPLEVGPLNTARGSGERCKLPQRGLGLSSSGNPIWCILALKPDNGNNFTNFPENQLPTVYAMAGFGGGGAWPDWPPWIRH